METPETTKPQHFCRGFVLYGAGTRSRTRDLLITSGLSRGFLKFQNVTKYQQVTVLKAQ